MSIMVLARRTITFRQPERGEVTVLLVPGRDQIQVIKDLAGMNDATMQAQVAGRGPQLGRVFSGQRYIYGYLPPEVQELRQGVKVWLAEDYAPSDCQAFFYVFAPEVIVHGVREQSDEGQQSWRTAQLVLEGGDPIRSLIDSISDYVLANPGAVVSVAVLNQLEIYRKLQASLAPYQIAPVPFSTLKPLPGVRPLYRHFDHTLIYLTGALFGLLILLASAAYWFMGWSERSKIEEQIADVQTRIKNIQINQSIGHIRRPQVVLDNMAKAFNQQPSALVDAAASVAIQFGDLQSVTFRPPEVANNVATKTPEQEVSALIKNPKDKLLFDQERRAQRIIEQRPWVRSVKRTGAQGNQMQLVVSLQAEGAEEATASIIEQANKPLPELPPSDENEVSGTTVSGEGSPSGTVPPEEGVPPHAAGGKLQVEVPVGTHQVEVPQTNPSGRAP